MERMFLKYFADTVKDKIKTISPPRFLVIQLGSNDLRPQRSNYFLRLKMLLPNTKAVWSEIRMWLYWHHADNVKNIDKARKGLFGDKKLRNQIR